MGPPLAGDPASLTRCEKHPVNWSAKSVVLQKGPHRQIASARVDAGGVIGLASAVGIQKPFRVVCAAEGKIELVKVFVDQNEVQGAEKTVLLKIAGAQGNGGVG